MSVWKHTEAFEDEQEAIEQERDDRLQQAEAEEQELEFALGVAIHSATQALDYLGTFESRLHPSFRAELRALRRALRGCRHCKRILGDVHPGSCPSGGYGVTFIDLEYEDLKPEPDPLASEPF